MRITVLPHKRIPSPEADDFDQRDADAEPCDWDEAFARTWTTDAHFTAYEPVCPPELRGAAVRLASGALGEVPVRMVALVGDLDDPEAHRTKAPASEEWRAQQLPRLIASRLSVYRTRGGFRVLAVLREPVDLRSPDDARLWRATYLGWCAEQKAKHGLDLDVSCADWTRLFRLPNVRRDGVDQRARLEGAGFPIVDALAIPVALPAAAPTVAVEGADDRELTDREREELDAAAELIEPSYRRVCDGGAGRNNLALAIGGWVKSVGLPPSAAVHVVSQLPSDQPEARVSDALRAWSKPGPVEGWAALRRLLPPEALAAVQALNVGPSAKKGLLERMAARRERSATPAPESDPADPFALLGRQIDLAAEPEPLAYMFDGLPFAPGGKVNALAGPPNAGKSPFAEALMFARVSGREVAGVKSNGVGWAVYLDAETGRLAHIRWRRICRAYSVDPKALSELVDFRDVEVTFTEKFCETLEAYAVKRGPGGLVIVDTYGAMLGADVDYNTPEFALWLRALGRLSRALDVVIVVLIHEKKTGDGRVRGSALEMISGSFSAAGAMQAVVSLRPTGDRNDDPITVSCTRAPEDKFEPFSVKWSDVRDPQKPEGGRYAQAIDGAKDAERQARLWGLRVDRADAVAAPTDATPDAADLAYGRKVLERLGAVPAMSERKLVRDVAGPKRETKLGILEQLVSERLILRVESPIAGGTQGVRVFTDYTLAPRTASNAEAWVRWSS